MASMASGTLSGAKTAIDVREAASSETTGVTSIGDQARREAGVHDLVLKTFRLLIADLCQQFGGGHPGGAMGMAALGVALWKYVMQYSPHGPDWLNRDRFVLSNGHTCLLQYAFLHLTGYKAMTMDQLKSYHSRRVDGLCPGHPEIEHEGIELTTGPLGQGVGNSVGLAIATKHLAATFNRPRFPIFSNHTWCVVGDACLQEGVALEAISLAGHLRLDNLTIIYDNNQITCDGSVDLANTEDVNAKMRACGWEVMEIQDGSRNVVALVDAFEKAKTSDRPTFINVRTVIGLGSKVAGMADAHGAALGKEDVANMKTASGFDPDRHFVVGDKVLDFFRSLPSRGRQLQRQWEGLLNGYAAAHPDLAARFRSRTSGELDPRWRDLMPGPTSFPAKPTPTRASSGLVLGPIAREVDSFMVGTADLSPSVHMSWPGKVDFQHPNLRPSCGIHGDYTGRYVHYGIREHAMCAVANGLAAFAPEVIVPVTSTFFMFYLYAAPAVRMGALQRLHVIHAATHDSIGMGEDGPTHQPVELAALYRAMPNLVYIRPGDSEETAGAWTAAIAAKERPTIVSTSRHAVPQLEATSRDGVLRGAYVLRENDSATVTLLGAGAELSHAVEVAERLMHKHGIRTRVVSFPSWRLFEEQPREYKRDTLRRRTTKVVAIEPYAPNGWERYADAAACLRTFGHSLPGTAAYEYFGFDSKSLTAKVLNYLTMIEDDRALEHEFVEL